MTTAERSRSQSPGTKEYPNPEPTEALVFRDYFKVGLHFPLEGFVAEVLDAFNLQLHHLTPNAIVCLSCYAMAQKMMGSELSVPVFTRHYETQLYSTYGIDEAGTKELRLEVGSYNFVPTRGNTTACIVLTFKNKWQDWKKHWFYYRVCDDADVALARERGQPKAHPLVSVMTQMEGLVSAPEMAMGPLDDAAAESYRQTAERQTSRELVEEMLSLGQWPLCTSLKFDGFSYH